VVKKENVLLALKSVRLEETIHILNISVTLLDISNKTKDVTLDVVTTTLVVPEAVLSVKPDVIPQDQTN
jgi:hypothetical protein